jgi:hypothetical protein
MPAKKSNEVLSFYDVRLKKKFKTSEYKIVTKKVQGRSRRFAVATSPGGTPAWRVLANK